MPAPPAHADLFPAGALAPATFKTKLAEFFDYAVALLGASGTAADARTALEAPSRKEVQSQTYTAYTTGGTSTAYTLTSSPALAALTTGEEFDVTFHTAAGATPTLARDGLTAKALKYRGSAGAKVAVTAAQIPSGWRSKVVYDGTDYIVREVPPAAGLPRSYLAGLTLANNGADATNDIDIAVGECRDSTNAVDLVLASALTKRLDAAWAVGTNQGGLDAGSIADTTYHFWLIKRSDTGVVDALFSTSASAPTMPANYDYKRRIGAVVRASAAILPFVQDGNEFTLKTPVRDVNTGTPGAAAFTATLASVPAGIRVGAKIMASIMDTASIDFVLISDLSVNDASPSGNASPGLTARSQVANATGTGVDTVWTNTSRQVRARCLTGAATATAVIVTRGWIDTRGRES